MNRGKLGGVVFLIGIGGLLANCGGDSFQSDGDENGGGSGDGAGGSAPSGGASGTSGTGPSTGGSGATASGGRSSGGSGAVTGGAGGAMTGGAMTGGAMTGGAMTGGTTTGGAAGAGGEPGFCLLPADPGNCLAAMPRYFFNPATGVCQPFTYGGCGGNENNFESIEECYGACGGQGEIDPVACEYPTDCALVPAACCGACDQANLANMVAVNATKAAEVSMAMGCHLVDCATCPPSPNPWLGATCRAGRCVAFDARQTELTECSVREDCRLRAGLACCEACAPSRDAFIAVSRDANVVSWVCGEGPVVCAGCVPSVPPNLSITCADGRCGVLDAELPQ